MPDFVPDVLKKEVEVGGRKIPLWVPAAGGLLAVGVFALVKLTGRGKAAGGTSDQAEAAATSAATTSFASSLTEKVGEAQAGFSEQIGTLQANVAEQIARAQEQVGSVQSAQAALSGQLTGYQSQMAEQTGALQAGIAGVETAQAAFKTDVNARIGAVEQRTSDLEKKGNKLTPADRAAIIDMGVALGTPLTTLWRRVTGDNNMPYPIAGPRSFQWGPTSVEFPQ